MSRMLISGTFTILRPISCEKCGKTVYSSHAFMIDRRYLEDVPNMAEKMMPNIPAGWSMNGRDHLVCIDCIMQRDTPL